MPSRKIKKDTSNQFTRSNKSNKTIVIIIVAGVIVAGVIIAGISALFFFYDKRSDNFPNNFPLTDSQIASVTSFFASNPSQEQISAYCSGNITSCFYYCRQIASSNDFCKNMTNYSRGNYSGSPRRPMPYGGRQ